MQDVSSAGADRTAAFQDWLAKNPDIPIANIAAYCGRSPKTVYMWRLGRPKPIPAHFLQIITSAKPASLRKSRTG